MFSKQFKALLRITGFFAGSWAAVGAAIGAAVGAAATGDTIGSAALRFALMYGLAGGMAGTTTAFLAARTESGKRLDDIPTWRLVAWGVAGGVAPAATFGLLALVAGSPIAGVLPLLGLGVVGGAFGGLISGSASAAAKAARLPDDEPTRLPAA